MFPKKKKLNRNVMFDLIPQFVNDNRSNNLKFNSEVSKTYFFPCQMFIFLRNQMLFC